MGDAFSALALKRDLPQDLTLAYWQEAHSACEKSLTVWKDKEKRGELQSGEHDDLQQAAQCVTHTEAKLHNSKSAQASLH